jgi:hypothetical protein
MSIQVRREVQIEREVFLSQLPGAVGDREYDVSGNVITVKDGDRRIRIELISEGTAKKGALRLPVKQIVLDFDGFDQQQVDEFMKHYDLATRRPGGA